MDKKITVIVPVYNTKKFLKRCIMSIMNQSYSNLEIIIINDGSTDGSEKICNELEKADERIRVIHQKNNGIAATRNIGIENATGQYISFVDSDDYLAVVLFETQKNKYLIGPDGKPLGIIPDARKERPQADNTARKSAHANGRTMRN